MTRSPLPSTFETLNPQDADFAVRVIEQLLPLAVQQGASDVHLQPRSEGWEILFRIDGVLSVRHWLPGGGASDPVSRLMVLAGLPTYRSGKPMEGRIQWHPSQGEAQPVSIRLGVFPTIHGPRAVIRLLRKDDTHDTLDSLALPADLTARLGELCEQTDGAILLSGPAGSGKTTTMYAMLRRIASALPRRSVMTIEDPVESVIESISQSELDPNSGMTLASALRSAVRQDSEVMLVSEVRDPETAEAVMQASLTGHLVFSSLHATDVAASLRRLVQLGVPSFVVRSGVRAIISQRLLRRLCPECGRGASATPTEVQRAGESPSPVSATATSPRGCPRCMDSGYRGRIAVAHCVFFDGSDPSGEAMVEALESGVSAVRMRQVAARTGVPDLLSRARAYVAEGLTDAAEVYRVLGRGDAPTD